MSAPVMYTLPPILDHAGPLQLPTNMYSLPRIQGSLEIIPMTSSKSDEATELRDLESRQERLLQRLTDLKTKVVSTRKDLGLPNPCSSSSESKDSSLSAVDDHHHVRRGVDSSSPISTSSFMSSSSTWSGLVSSPIGERRRFKILDQISTLKASLHELKSLWRANPLPSDDAPTMTTTEAPPANPRKGPVVLVIQANPTHPPYGLLCMIQHLSGKIQLQSSSHCHSSLTDPLPTNLADFLPETNCQDKSKLQLKVSIIWKNVEREPQSVIGLRTLIRGEANLARYLARSFSAHFDYESDAKTANKTDALLDKSHADLVWGDNGAAFLKHLEVQLSSRKSLVGNSLGMADFLVWSAIVSSGLRLSSAALQSWSQACQRISGVSTLQESCQKRGRSTSRERRSSDVKRKSAVKGNARQLSSKDPKSELFEFFAANGIAFHNIDHPEVFTVEAMMPHLAKVDGAVTKNLFLKDKDKKLYLLSALHDRNVNLSEIGKKIKAKDLRFADEKVMLEVLGVKQGCVTAYALVNDVKGEVNFLVDEALVSGCHAKVYFHPLVNSASTGISCSDFKIFLDKTGHDYTAVKFS